MSQITVGGTSPPGNPPLDNPLLIGGSDGAAVRSVLTDNNGRVVMIGAAVDGTPTLGPPIIVAGTDGSNVRELGVNAQHQQLCNLEGQKATYTAVLTNFTPVASATDFFTIFGSASKTIRILRLRVTGTATASATVDILAIKRSTADSAGTFATVSALPHDANDPAATAALLTYSANPTLGTTVGTIMARKLGLITANSNVTPHLIELSMGTANERTWVLRGATSGIGFNWNGAAVPSGTVLDVELTWTEE